MHDDAVPLYPQESCLLKMEPASAGGSTAPAPINSPLPMLLGPENSVTTCPHCQCAVKTTIKHTTTSRTHLAAAICFFICCCCCIPYCSNSAKNTDHYCPNCFKFLGTYEK